MFPSTLSTSFRRNIRQIAQFCTNVSASNLTFKPRFSEEEQQKILAILNESNVEQLAQFDVTKVRIKNLESWKAKYGPFQTLHDILEVEGLGEKVLERLCKSIVNERHDAVQGAPNLAAGIKKRGQVISPALSYDTTDNLKNAVGIHVSPNGVSWAKLCVEKNELETWNFYNFTHLPKKLLPTDVFELSLDILSKIPSGDVYVMEAAKQQAVQNVKTTSTYSQQLELSSMLLALLNTSAKHNLRDESGAEQLILENKVYYLRANVPARLFSTLVGNERVAATGIIQKLLDRNSSLPCSAISVNLDIRNYYEHQNSPDKEMLGQAAMLVISFMDLCIYRNPLSQLALQPSRRRMN